jgi:uncharacterized protein (TIGR03437 family)
MICLSVISAAGVLLNAWPAHSQAIITTFAGNGNTTFSGDGGPATAASLNHPRGLAIDTLGGVYIADSDNWRVRRVSPAGVISTVAGNGSYGAAGDGSQAISASFSDVTDIALDGAGNLYIADASNRRIRKVTPGGIVTTVAGTGVQGSSGDGGLAINATLNRPISVAIDAVGNLYICDSSNHNIRRVNLASGVITTYAGNGAAAFSGDGGPATAASLMFPLAVSLDKSGNLYIADAGNNCIRKVTPGGVIATVAGIGNRAGFAGDGAAATGALLNIPSDVTVNGSGSLWIADSGNNRVRLVDGSSGVISTIAGGYNDGFSGDGGPAIDSLLSFPWKLTLDAAGSIYIADRVNNRIRKISAPAATLTSLSAASYIPNGSLAPSMIVSAFGQGLADSIASAAPPLPPTLANVGVSVKDAAGVSRAAQLYFVSPNQINYVIPEQTSVGTATVTATKNGQIVGSGTVQVALIAPGIFTANGNGQGAASGMAVTYPAQTRQFTATCAASGSCVTAPLDVGAAATSLFLELFGTGIRGTKSGVTATIGGTAANAIWAVQSQYPGMDQVNILVPSSMAGRGEVDVVLTVDGSPANPVRVNLK